jgi:outer membrane receptor protein involved in Fe transport
MPIRKPLRQRPLLGALGLAIALLSPAPGGAEEPVQLAQAEPQGQPPARTAPPDAGVEEIVVKGAESAVAQDFDAADSVTAFSAADLVALGAANISDIAAFTPNLEIVTAGATTATFFIRGVGLNDFNPNATGAVAVYQDDVPMNTSALQLGTLFDQEAVNVLKGPQAIGLARNASAGAIKIYGRKPTGQYTGFLRANGGNYSYQEYEGAIETPIYQDMLSARVSFIKTMRDGTMHNRCAGAPPPDQRVPVPDANTLITNHQTKRDAPWSICGEPVDFVDGDLDPNIVKPVGISDMPMGLAHDVNDRNNWAARGILRFEPTLETSFLLNAHGSHRNEYSRLGQSIGTNGEYCLNGDYANCLVTPDRGGSRVLLVLGGSQGQGGEGYTPREILEDISFYAPCVLPNGYSTCAVRASGGPSFGLYDRAKQLVARQLARNLDDEPWKGDFNRTGKTVNDTVGVAFRSEILLPLDIELTTMSAFDRYYRHIDLDLDFSPETLFQIDTRDDGYQFYQDANFAGELPVNDTPVSWNVGGWVLPEKLDVKAKNDLGAATFFAVGARTYTQRLLSMGGYGDFSFDFAEDFTLDGGVRWNYERKDMNYYLERFGGAETLHLKEHDNYRAPTGTIRLNYRFREDTSAFMKYTRGFKPGHYNATGSPVSGITTADPEYIDAYETGLRAEWFGGILGGEASFFYYNYKDYQIFTAQQFAGSAPEFIVVNANDAEVYGADVTALLRPWAGGYVNVNFGWLETQFLDFTLLQQEIVTFHGAQTTINRELQNSGHPLLNSPKYKVAITAEQAIPLGKYGYLVPRYDAAWSDTTYYDATKGRGIPNLNGVAWAPKLSFAQRAHWIHNARVAYRTPDGRLEIAGWVRNMFNDAYKTFAFDGSTFQRTTIYFVGDPRTYGVTATVTF